jgi:hypothetical protein
LSFLAAGVAAFVLGVFTPDCSTLLASSGFSGFGFDATDVVAKPRAGLAAGFFFLPAIMIYCGLVCWVGGDCTTKNPKFNTVMFSKRRCLHFVTAKRSL